MFPLLSGACEHKRNADPDPAPTSRREAAPESLPRRERSSVPAPQRLVEVAKPVLAIPSIPPTAAAGRGGRACPGLDAGAVLDEALDPAERGGALP